MSGRRVRCGDCKREFPFGDEDLAGIAQRLPEHWPPDARGSTMPGGRAACGGSGRAVPRSIPREARVHPLLPVLATLARLGADLGERAVRALDQLAR